MPPGLANLAALLADTLAELTNATLALDPAGAARLATLEGRTIELRARMPGAADAVFSLRIQHGRLRLVPAVHGTPDTIVTGTLPDLLGWALSRGRHTPPGLRIDGDTGLLEALAAVAEGFAPDLEAPLERFMGADAAGRVAAAAELTFAGLRTLFDGAAGGLRRGAAQWFATAPAANAFLDELDDLKLRVDRLAARVERAERTAAGRVAASSGSPPEAS